MKEQWKEYRYILVVRMSDCQCKVCKSIEFDTAETGESEKLGDESVLLRIYRPSFHENEPKATVFLKWKPAFCACFRENFVYKFGHGSFLPVIVMVSSSFGSTIHNALVFLTYLTRDGQANFILSPQIRNSLGTFRYNKPQIFLLFYYVDRNSANVFD